MFFQLPFLAEYAVRRHDFAFIEKLWQDWSPGWKYPAEFIARVKETFRQPGVVEAALAYYRALPDFITAAGRASFHLVSSQVHVPTLAITGANDGCLDSEIFDTLLKKENFPRGLRLERIAGAGHFVHREKPEAIISLLREWLKTNSPAAS